MYWVSVQFLKYFVFPILGKESVLLKSLMVVGNKESMCPFAE